MNNIEIAKALNPEATSKIEERVAEWLEELTLRGSRPSGFSYAFGTETLTKFVRVWQDNVSPEGIASGRSVHAFYDPITGDVFKSEGWRKPAKGARYNLLNDQSFDTMMERCGATSAYLYRGAK
jgi:hypothetical protein